MIVKRFFRKIDVNNEECIYFESSKQALDLKTVETIKQLFTKILEISRFRDSNDVVEWGTAQYFESPYSHSNVVDIFSRLGLINITRVEKTTRTRKAFFNKSLIDPNYTADL